MNTPGKDDAQSPKKTDLLDLVTGKVGKITALIAALTLVVTNLDTLVSKVQVVAKKLSPEEPLRSEPSATQPPQSCVEIYKVSFPETIDYSQWDDHHISVTGRNNCNRDLGLYVTFTHRVGSDPPRVVLRSPYADSFPECTGAAAQSQPKCWDQMKPIPIIEGRGQWDAPLPPVFRLGEFQTERLRFRLEVHDLDAPSAEAAWKKTVEIEIRDDAGR